MIKKMSLVLLCLSTILFISCSKKKELKPVNFTKQVKQIDNLIIQVNPKNELFLIGCRLADAYYFDSPTDDVYVNTADKLFNCLRDHAFVKDLKKMSKNKNGSLSLMLEFAEYISDDITKITVEKNDLRPELKEFLGRLNFSSFLVNFNDFAQKSNYERFALVNDAYQKAAVNNIAEFYNVNNKMIPWFNSFVYSEENKPLIEINVSDLLLGYYIYLNLHHENGRDHIPFYQAPGSNMDGWNDVYIVDGFIHYKSCDILEKNWDLVKDKLKLIANKIYEDNQIIAEDKDWFYIANISRAVFTSAIEDYIRLVKPEEDASLAIKQFEESTLYEDIEKVNKMFALYKNSRDTYKDFETFFSNYMVKELNGD